MTSDLAAFGRKLDAISKEFTGEAGRERLLRVANKTKPDIDSAVRSDIGDLSMSGWKRRKPIQIRGVVKVEGDTVAMVPSAAGPMRVLQNGRNQGGGSHGMSGPGQFAAGGGTVRKKNGQVKATRARKAKRWSGYTEGKATWSDATAIMVDKVPDRYATELHSALAKHLTGG